MSRKILGLSKRNWKCFIVGNIIGWAVALCALACRAGVPVEFTVETSRADVHEQPCYHGETLDFDVTFKSYGKDLMLPTNAQANIFWQTNGMSAFFWRTNNVTVVSNKMYSTFTPAMDPGTGSCFGFLGIPGVNYRASFVLRFKNSPGAEPKIMEWPYRELDFDKVEMLNEKWYRKEITDAKDAEIRTWTEENVPRLIDVKMTNSNPVVIGYKASFVGTNSVTIGTQAKGSGDGSVAIGKNAVALGSNGIGIGNTARGSSEGLAMGSSSEATTRAIALGKETKAYGAQGVAVGTGAEATEEYATAIGSYSKAQKIAGVAIGPSAKSEEQYGISIGFEANAAKKSAVAIGKQTEATEEMSLAIGERATASGVAGSAIGYGTTSAAQQGTAVGYGATAIHVQSTVIAAGGLGSSKSTSHGNKTVTIGVESGEKVYIGDSNLVQIIRSEIKDGTNGLIRTETDPTIPSWAKAANPPTETDPTVPSWAKNPTPPVTTETDPTVPGWAKATNKPTYSAAEVGAYPDASGQMLSAQVATQGAHLNAEDAQCVVTNYDSVTHLREMKLRIKLQEGGTNVWREIWDEMDRWNAFTGTNFNWQSWIGVGAWIRNIEAALDMTSPKEYAFYDGVTGEVAPDGFFWISQPRIGICAGAGYQRYLDAGAAVWILESNGMCANVGGTTNGYFRISDEEGNVHFEIVKGDKETVPAISRSVTCTNVMGVTHWYSVYAVTNAISPPVAKFCRDLATQTWVADTEASCPCNVDWKPGENTYTLEFWPKANEPKMFCKAEYDKGGETKIRQTVPTEMQYIILNGTKYGLVPKTVNGELVMGLTTGGQ